MNRPPLDRRALGLSLNRLANASVADVFKFGSGTSTGRPARRIGLTGPPGAGKSSLIGRLAQLRAPDRRMGVLAIDPTSPKSGGAILGDRIRMDELTGIEDLYIRSFGSRSATDGLTDNLPELLAVMDAHDFDEVMVETVGVGQAEYAIRAQVDTLILVLLPESGDAIQAMKAGIMEMADIFVINKSDLAGAPKMASDIKRTLAMLHRNAGDRLPPVLLTSSDDTNSIQRLSHEIDRHQAFLEDSGKRNALLAERARYRLRQLVERQSRHVIHDLEPAFFDTRLEAQYMSVLDRLKQVD
jgi:LAO/AO transport system kinase